MTSAEMLSALATIKTWDNTTLENYQRCPRKFELGILRSLVPKRKGRALDYGAALHEGLAAWYLTGPVVGAELPSLESIAARVTALAVQAGFGEPDASKWTHTGLRTELAILTASAFLPPLDDADANDHRTHELLEATLRAYTKQYEYEPFKVLHVEQNFAFALPGGYLYSGIMDLVIDWNDEVMPMDHKTASSLLYLAEKYVINQQFSGYIHGLHEIYPNAGDHGVVNGIMTPRRKELVIKPEDFKRSTNITRTAEAREEFLVNTVATIENIHHNAERGYFAMDGAGSGACNDYGGCAFKRICAASGPERELIAANFYEKRQWDPMRRDEGKAAEQGGE